MKKASKEEAAAALQRARSAIPQLRQLKVTIEPFQLGLGSLRIAVCPQEFFTWHTSTSLALEHVFGKDFTYTQEFRDIKKLINPAPLHPSADLSESINERTTDYFRMLDRADSLLYSLQSHIIEFWESGESATTSSNAQATDAPTTNDVFVVHGRDAGVTNTVARFLERLGLNPIILAEQPSQGLTIIEKFERHSQVGFAIVLLTPDDAGALGGEAVLSPRARQNVIFELGFFFGRLGRRRVCVLAKGKLEIPSNYAGVEYIPLDERGSWKVSVFNELRAAGFRVDADRLVNA